MDKGKMFRTLLVIPSLMVTTLLEGRASADDSRAELIAALKDDAAVQAEISRVHSNLPACKEERYEFVEIGGSCGVAGCDSKTLAVISLHRGGVNPQSAAVLATIDRHHAKLGKVTLVELKAKDDDAAPK